MSNLVVQISASGGTSTLSIGGKTWRCAIGRGGISAAKREGDGVTPVGIWPLRRMFYRPDRLDPPPTILAARALAAEDGWCDDPDHADYNHLVRLPHDARCENLWRVDHLYDIIVVLGHNDDPVVAGAGSAIFMHLASPDDGPTEGCVALAKIDLIEVLGMIEPASCLEIIAQAAEL